MRRFFGIATIVLALLTALAGGLWYAEPGAAEWDDPAGEDAGLKWGR